MLRFLQISQNGAQFQNIFQGCAPYPTGGLTAPPHPQLIFSLRSQSSLTRCARSLATLVGPHKQPRLYVFK